MTDEERLKMTIGYIGWHLLQMRSIQFKALEPAETVAQFKQRNHPDWAISTKDWTTPCSR
jgi:hypothetical protein